VIFLAKEPLGDFFHSTKKKIMWKNIWHYFTMFLPPGSCGKTLGGHQTIFFHLIQEKKREKKK